MAAIVPLLVMAGLAFFQVPGLLNRSVVEQISAHIAEPTVYRELGPALWMLGPNVGALGLAIVLGLTAISPRRRDRGPFFAGVVALAVAAGVHLSGTWSLVDRTPRDFVWQFFMPLDLACTVIAIAWLKRGWRRSDVLRFEPLLGAWTVTALPVFAHATLELDLREQVTASALYFATYLMIALFALCSTTAKPRVVALAYGSFALWISCLLAALPIWVTVTGSRAYVASSGDEKFFESCDFRLGLSDLGSAQVTPDPVCENAEFRPLVYGINAALGALAIAAVVLGGRRIASRSSAQQS